MKKMEMVKSVGQIVISVGVGAIVGNAVKSTTPADIGTIKKFCVGVGTFVLSNMVCEKATEYGDGMFDKFTRSFVKEVIEVEN